MKECYQIKTSKELVEYLKKQGRDAFHDWDYQLKTNYGFVHELRNGQIAFFDNRFKHEAILFETKKCFDDVLNSEQFPLENPNKEPFEIEGKRMLTFHLQSEYYRQYLNNVLKFNYPTITKDSAQAYLKKVIGRSIKCVTKPTDVVALISVIGELVKQETNGKWFLQKRYGLYNPVYEPNIITKAGNIFWINSRIFGSIKWRTSSLDHIFIDVHSSMIEPTKWRKYSKGQDNLIILG